VVEAEPEALATWAASLGIAFTGHRALLTDADVRGRLDGDVRGIVRSRFGLSVDRVVLAPEPLREEHGELTPLLAVRRDVIARRHARPDTAPAPQPLQPTPLGSERNSR
jgi:long-subunit acyl-CoA synthetase (AMP-forming)